MSTYGTPSWQDKYKFLQELLIPSFNPELGLVTSGDRNGWIRQKGRSNNWNEDLVKELLGIYWVCESARGALKEQEQVVAIMSMEGTKRKRC